MIANDADSTTGVYDPLRVKHKVSPSFQFFASAAYMFAELFLFSSSNEEESSLPWVSLSSRPAVSFLH